MIHKAKVELASRSTNWIVHTLIGFHTLAQFLNFQQGPYQVDSTASRLLSEANRLGPGSYYGEGR
jgi:hypothetical protein